MQMLSISKLFFVIVAPWMVLLYPLAAFAMWMDMQTNNAKGGGWIFVGRKP